MEKTLRSKKVLAGLLAVALVFGAAPASLYSSGALTGTVMTASADDDVKTEPAFTEIRSVADQKKLNDTIVRPTEEQVTYFKNNIISKTFNFLIMDYTEEGYEVYDVYEDKTFIDKFGAIIDNANTYSTGVYYLCSEPTEPKTYTKDSEGIADGIILQEPFDTIDTSGTQKYLYFDENIRYDGTRFSGQYAKDHWQMGVNTISMNENLRYKFETDNDTITLLRPENKTYIIRYDSENDFWHIGTVHKHKFSYKVNDTGDTATAECVEGCDITDGLSIAISAEDAVYDGKPHGAVLSDFNKEVFPGANTIRYFKADEGTPGSVSTIPVWSSAEAPTEAGEYRAEVFLGNFTTLYTTFSITKADPAPQALDTAYDGKPHALITGGIPEGTLFSLTEPSEYDDYEAEAEKVLALSKKAAEKRDLSDKTYVLYSYYADIDAVLGNYRSCIIFLNNAAKATTEDNAASCMAAAQDCIDDFNDDLSWMEEHEKNLPEGFIEATGGKDYIEKYVKGATIESIKERFTDPTPWTDKVPEKTEIGEYTVWYKVSNPNYNDTIACVTAKITKADTKVPELKAAEDLTADGSAKKLIEPVTVDGGTVKYALGKDDKTPPADEEFSEEIPTADKEGTYCVWAKVFGDNVHNDSEAVCIKVEMKAPVSEDDKDDDNPPDDTTTEEEYQLGDVDSNSRVDSRDIVKTAAHIKGIKTLSADEKLRADTDENAKINSGDIVKMAAHIKGMKILPKIKVKK